MASFVQIRIFRGPTATNPRQLPQSPQTQPPRTTLRARRRTRSQAIRTQIAPRSNPRPRHPASAPFSHPREAQGFRFRTRTAAVYAIQAHLIDPSPNQRDFITVGMPGNLNSGFGYPHNSVTINLAPANLRKEGAGFDLPMAVCPRRRKAAAYSAFRGGSAGSSVSTSQSARRPCISLLAPAQAGSSQRLSSSPGSSFRLYSSP